MPKTRAEKLIKLAEADDAFHIYSKQITADRIAIMLDDGSIAELDADQGEFWKKTLESEFNIKVDGSLFWFARLKAGRRGEGQGSVLF